MGIAYRYDDYALSGLEVKGSSFFRGEDLSF
jgi:hypothetical protein